MKVPCLYGHLRLAAAACYAIHHGSAPSSVCKAPPAHCLLLTDAQSGVSPPPHTCISPEWRPNSRQAASRPVAAASTADRACMQRWSPLTIRCGPEDHLAHCLSQWQLLSICRHAGEQACERRASHTAQSALGPSSSAAACAPPSTQSLTAGRIHCMSNCQSDGPILQARTTEHAACKASWRASASSSPRRVARTTAPIPASIHPPISPVPCSQCAPQALAAMTAWC